MSLCVSLPLFALSLLLLFQMPKNEEAKDLAVRRR
jgi:hypothetical protein